MNAAMNLLSRVEDAISSGSLGRQAEMLRHVTDLFVIGSPQCTEEDVAVFDSVFTRLAAEIETAARALLSTRLAPISNVLALGDTGSVKILAVLEPMRFARRPDIPSMSEAIPAFRKPSSWFGVFGPAGLPAPMAGRLNGEIVKALGAAEVRTKLDENGLAMIGGTPEDFRALIADGIARYGAIIKAAGIKPE